jgi:hypothetical protein
LLGTEVMETDPRVKPARSQFENSEVSPVASFVAVADTAFPYGSSGWPIGG